MKETINWIPIETPPPKYSSVLLLCIDPPTPNDVDIVEDRPVRFGFLDDGGYVIYDTGGWDGVTPTHWAEYPKGPVKDGK